MTAPTEAEIREAIEPEWPVDTVGDAPEWVYEGLGPILDSDQALVRAVWVEGYNPMRPHPGTLWADMTKAEADELHAAISVVVDEAAMTFQRSVLEGAVRAAVAFAEKHPDVPRGHWKAAEQREPVTAG
ncbi:MAG TPA: hypothetical protein VM451_09465 [Candidatus Limnocylindria bacterium]|nr:hypothetical protein [Candidatus Limnocylindria bacterium]